MIESQITAKHIFRCVLWDIYSKHNCQIDDRFKNLTDIPFPTYNKDTDGLLNKHHWTFPYVWEKFFPYLAEQLDIPFNPNDFKLVPDAGNDDRFNRHLWKTDFKCDAYRFKTKSTELHTYLDCCSNGGITKYHSIIRYPHESVLYRVENVPGTNNHRRLLLNCDSMSIPLIPLLLPYYQAILCLDFRYDMGKDDYDIIESFEYTDYACIMYEKSYCLNKHIVHNLTYTPKNIKPKPLQKETPHNRRKAILNRLKSIYKKQ